MLAGVLVSYVADMHSVFLIRTFCTTHNACRNTNRRCTSRNVVYHNGSGTDFRVFTNRNTSKQYRTRPNHYPIVDHRSTNGTIL